MVSLTDITAEPGIEGASCDLSEGVFAAFVMSGQPASEAMVRLLLGLQSPQSGSVKVLDHDLAKLPQPELLSLRRLIGVVHSGGGLISNLKVLENVALPLAYEGRVPQGDIAGLAEAALERVGYSGSISELPGNLPLHIRRLIGFARVLLVRPQLVIYNDTFEGFPASERDRVMALAAEFHREEPGRTSLLVTSNPGLSQALPINHNFYFNNG